MFYTLVLLVFIYYLHFKSVGINKKGWSAILSLSIILVTSFLDQIINLFICKVETLDISLHADGLARLWCLYLLVHLLDVVVVLIVTVWIWITHWVFGVGVLVVSTVPIELEEWNPLQHFTKLLFLFYGQIVGAFDLFFQTGCFIHIFGILRHHVNYVFALFQVFA